MPERITPRTEQRGLGFAPAIRAAELASIPRAPSGGGGTQVGSELLSVARSLGEFNESIRSFAETNNRINNRNASLQEGYDKEQAFLDYSATTPENRAAINKEGIDNLKSTGMLPNGLTPGYYMTFKRLTDSADIKSRFSPLLVAALKGASDPSNPQSSAEIFDDLYAKERSTSPQFGLWAADEVDKLRASFIGKATENKGAEVEVRTKAAAEVTIASHVDDYVRNPNVEGAVETLSAAISASSLAHSAALSPKQNKQVIQSAFAGVLQTAQVAGNTEGMEALIRAADRMTISVGKLPSGEDQTAPLFGAGDREVLNRALDFINMDRKRKLSEGAVLNSQRIAAYGNALGVLTSRFASELGAEKFKTPDGNFRAVEVLMNTPYAVFNPKTGEEDMLSPKDMGFTPDDVRGSLDQALNASPTIKREDDAVLTQMLAYESSGNIVELSRMVENISASTQNPQLLSNALSIQQRMQSKDVLLNRPEISNQIGGMLKTVTSTLFPGDMSKLSEDEQALYREKAEVFRTRLGDAVNQLAADYQREHPKARQQEISNEVMRALGGGKRSELVKELTAAATDFSKSREALKGASTAVTPLKTPKVFLEGIRGSGIRKLEELQGQLRLQPQGEKLKALNEDIVKAKRVVESSLEVVAKEVTTGIRSTTRQPIYPGYGPLPPAEVERTLMTDKQKAEAEALLSDILSRRGLTMDEVRKGSVYGVPLKPRAINFYSIPLFNSAQELKDFNRDATPADLNLLGIDSANQESVSTFISNQTFFLNQRGIDTTGPTTSTKPTPIIDYGTRNDGTAKGAGFLGEVKLPDGRVATEVSVGVNINGKEVEIPTLVPTLSAEQKAFIAGGGDPLTRPDIISAAAQHAKKRMSDGLSPFSK